MSETRTKPSAEAVKAARKMVYSVRGWQQHSPAFCQRKTEQWAEIIDAEHRELRECLRDCCVQIAAALNHPTDKGLAWAWRDSAFALKRRAEKLLEGK